MQEGLKRHWKDPGWNWNQYCLLEGQQRDLREVRSVSHDIRSEEERGGSVERRGIAKVSKEWPLLWWEGRKKDETILWENQRHALTSGHVTYYLTDPLVGLSNHH